MNVEALELLERQSYIQLEEGDYRGRINEVSERGVKPIGRAVRDSAF